MSEAVGLDVGGTKIAALRISGDGGILARHTLPTPSDRDLLLEAIVEAGRSVGADDAPAVGAGIAGMVDRHGVLRFSPNLPLRDAPVGMLLASAFDAPCVVDNDANAAAWGEHRFGAARGARSMLFLSVGTGIGGAIVVEGALWRGAHGFAGEIGHIRMDPDGPPCGCGNAGCWEQLASGAAIQRLGREAAVREPEGALSAAGAGDPKRIDGPLVTALAQQGDPTSLGILAEVAERLGVGIAGLVNTLDPEVVVVGGGAAEAGDLLLAPARAACARAIEAPHDRPEVPVLAAELGNDAGAVGAAALALDEASARRDGQAE